MWNHVICVDKNICPLLQAAVMSPPVDTSMSLHPTAMLTQQMGQLSLGSTGAVSDMDFIFFLYEHQYGQGVGYRQG